MASTRTERVLCDLRGVLADEAAVSTHLSLICTGYAVSVILPSPNPQSIGRAMLTGPGAYKAVLAAHGEQAESAARAFRMLRMHHEWFCPCGASGVEPLAYASSCATCGRTRPRDLAAAVAEIKAIEAAAAAEMSVPEQPEALLAAAPVLAAYCAEARPSRPPPPLPQPHVRREMLNDQFAAEDAAAAAAFAAATVTPQPLESAPATRADISAPPTKRSSSSSSADHVEPSAAASGADAADVLPPAKRQCCTSLGNALHTSAPPSAATIAAPPAFPHGAAPPAFPHGAAPPALGLASAVRVPGANVRPIERAEIFLGGVHARGPVAHAVEQVRTFLSALAGWELECVHVQPEKRNGCMRATLEGDGACDTASRLIGRVTHPKRNFEEVKMHIYWHCPCTRHPFAIRDDGACPVCGERKPPSLKRAAKRVEEIAAELWERQQQAQQAQAPQVPQAQQAQQVQQVQQVQQQAAREPLVALRPQVTPHQLVCGAIVLQQPAALRPPPTTVAPLAAAASRDSVGAKAHDVWNSAGVGAKALTPLDVWNGALGGNAIAAKQPRRALIYDKLDACLTSCHGWGGPMGGATGWRAWAFDVPGRGDGAPKLYLGMQLADFAGTYVSLRPEQRNVYEIIEASHPVWPYFDLEYEHGARHGVQHGLGEAHRPPLNHHVDGDALSTAVARAATEVLHEQFAIAWQNWTAEGAGARDPSLSTLDLSAALPRWSHLVTPSGTSTAAAADAAASAASATAAVLAPSLEVEVVALDSHKPTKYSRHLILRPHIVDIVEMAAATATAAPASKRLPLPLAGTAAAKVLARLVCDRLGEVLHVHTKKSAAQPPRPAPLPVGEALGEAAHAANAGSAAEAALRADPATASDGVTEAPSADDGAGTQAAKPASFVDLSVYTRNRCFRIVGSTKLGKPDAPPPPALVINDAACAHLPAELLSPPPSSRSMAEQLELSLVMPLLANGSSSDKKTQTAGTRSSDPDAVAAMHALTRRHWATLDLPEALLASAPAQLPSALDSESWCGPRSSIGPSRLHAGLDAGLGAGLGAELGAELGAGLGAELGATAAAAGYDGTHEVGRGDRAVRDGRVDVWEKGAAASPEAWLASIEGLTSTPLLDIPPGLDGGSLSKHPFVRYVRRGQDGRVPRPFDRLAAWATLQFGRWGGGVQASVGIGKWIYLRSEFPLERLLHLTATGTRFCFAKGRQHKGQHVMLTVDLVAQVAYQRCWDNTDCVVHGPRGIHLKSKHPLGRPPIDVLPTWAELQRFEETNETA